MEKPNLSRSGEYIDSDCPPIFKVKNRFGGCGTGFYLGEGRLLTVCHNVFAEGAYQDDQPAILNCFADEFKGTVSKKDPVLDLALIEVGDQLEGMPPLEICKEEHFQIGAPVDIFGFPADYNSDFPCYMVGTIAGSVNHPNGTKRLYINAPYNLGFSGGPILCPETSNVLGIVTAKPSPLSSLSRQSLKELEKDKRGAKTKVGGNDLTVAQMSASILQDVIKRRNIGFGYSPTVQQIEDFIGSA